MVFDDWVTGVITVLVALLASSGLWSLLGKRFDRKSATTKLLLGLAHDRIIYLGMSYVDRGWLTKDEYEDFVKYLYGPYSEFGGNGMAEKVMREVDKLPVRNREKIIVPLPRRGSNEHAEQQPIDITDVEDPFPFQRDV